jgi:hypothetical protein
MPLKKDQNIVIIKEEILKLLPESKVMLFGSRALPCSREEVLKFLL